MTLLPGHGESRWRRLGRNAAATSLATTASALVGSLVTDPESRWYKRLDLPAWQPPSAAFPIVWTGLYADIALVSALHLTDLEQQGRGDEASAFRRALAVNLLLNTGWSALFWQGRRPWLAAVECAVLTASSADLVRRVASTGRGRAVALGPYAAWTGFATALSAAIARRN